MRSATCKLRARILSAQSTKRRPTLTASCRKHAAGWRRSRRLRKLTSQQTVAEATGQTSRFLKIYEQYKKAPDVTRERMYLETMERVLGGTDKIILDSSAGGSGVVPYLPLNELLRPPQPRGQPQSGRPAMRTNFLGGILAVLVVAALIVGYSSVFTVYQTQQALVVRLGQPVRVVNEPGLNFKAPFIDSVVYIDKRILDLEAPSAGSDRVRSEAAGGRRIRALPHQDPLRFYQTLGSITARTRSCPSCSIRRCAACSARSHSRTWCAISVPT